MPRGKVERVRMLVACLAELSCSPATPMYRWLFPQASAARRGPDFGTETGQPFYSSNEGSQWQSLGNFLPPILRSRRRSFETISKFFQGEIARYRGLLKQRVSSFPVAG